MNALLLNRLALVTGGSAGIGGATVSRFLDEGARVVSLDIAEPAAAEGHDHLTTVVGNAADESTIRDTFSVLDQLGELDVVVANVGGGHEASAHETSLAHWGEVLELTLTATFLSTSFAAERMMRRGRGSIVAVSSVHGLRGFTRNPAYASAKAGIMGLVRQMATDYGPYGVRVNAVSPGPILTDGLHKSISAAPDPTRREANYRRWTALRRVGTPAEVAAAIAWLASDESSYITGHALVVDGGMTSTGHHDAPPEPSTMSPRCPRI